MATRPRTGLPALREQLLLIDAHRGELWAMGFGPSPAQVSSSLRPSSARTCWSLCPHCQCPSCQAFSSSLSTSCLICSGLTFFLPPSPVHRGGCAGFEGRGITPSQGLWLPSPSISSSSVRTESNEEMWPHCPQGKHTHCPKGHTGALGPRTTAHHETRPVGASHLE